MIRLRLMTGGELYVRPEEIRQVTSTGHYPFYARVLLGSGSEPRWRELSQTVEQTLDALRAAESSTPERAGKA